jgi:hypothetical protein
MVVVVVVGVNENQQTSNFLHHCMYFGKIDSASDGIVRRRRYRLCSTDRRGLQPWGVLTVNVLMFIFVSSF